MKLTLTVMQDQTATFDPDTASPVRLICAHRRYTLGTEQAKNTHLYTSWEEWRNGELLGILSFDEWMCEQRAILRGSGLPSQIVNTLCATWDENVPPTYVQDAYDAYVKEEEEAPTAPVVLPIYLYDHSGLSLSTSRDYPFNCPWDAGQVGWAVCPVQDGDREATERLVKDVVAEYNAFVTGSVYGYTLYDADTGDLLDDLWGIVVPSTCRVEEVLEDFLTIPEKVPHAKLVRKDLLAWLDLTPDGDALCSDVNTEIYDA